jgi:periplasmic divalent cation tolerance protein
MQSESCLAEFCLVLVTVPDTDLAKTIAQSLLEAKLAACINFFPIQSMYIWQNEIQSDAEYQLLIKTRTPLLEALQARVQTLHSYEVPEFLVLPIATGSPSYLEWLQICTGTHPAPHPTD